ncbi:MAG: Gfo/Idh/MocA family oxidoreductase [Oscillospiraceae bacterium]|nr:Gfo/Idh/MocA family oxidoreductase [Oscillospiraceae bacterium]
MADKIIRMGIIGYGGMARWHHMMMQTQDNLGIQAVAVYDISEAANMKAKEDGLRVCSSAAELLCKDDIDVVLIATPNDWHKPYAFQAMDAGIDVICEKPVTLCSADLQEMIDKANETGLMMTVHQNRRWDPDYRAILKVRDEGTIGNIFKIESRVSGANGIPGDWRAVKSEGGGMILDWGVHLIDQICDAYKEKITQVYARVQHITNQEVDDGFMAVLTFETGLVAVLEVTTTTYVNYPRWHVSGLYGTIQIDDWDLNGKIVREVAKQGHDELVPIQAGVGLTKTMSPRSSSTVEELPVPKVGGQHIEDEWRKFYDNIVAHINHGVPFIVKHDEVMRVMKVMEAIFQSEAENRAIDTYL